MLEERSAEGGRLLLSLELTVTSDRPGEKPQQQSSDGGGGFLGLLGGGDDTTTTSSDNGGFLGGLLGGCSNSDGTMIGDPYMLK